MKIINYVLFNIRLYSLNPTFYFLLAFTLFILLKSFDIVYFCDGESIEELKNKLSE